MPQPDGGANGSVAAAGPSRAPVAYTHTNTPATTIAGSAGARVPVIAVPVNALDLIGLRHALALMAPAAGPTPDALYTRPAIASPDGPEAEAIDRIQALEALKSACAAAQARETAALHSRRTQSEAAQGIPEARRGRGLPGEVGLARRTGARGSKHLRLALNLVADLPHTLEALTTGRISEDQAAAIDHQTHWLTPRQRQTADSALADRIEFLGRRELVQEAQAAAQGQDPATALQRQEQSCRERHLSLKPAETNPGMAYLTALLPIAQAAACYQNLTTAAASTIAEGDAVERSPQQVLTDLFVQRLTGQATAEAVPVEIQLIMTDTALLKATGNASGSVGEDSEAGTEASAGANADLPAWLPGHGPIPAPVARRTITDTEAEVFIRRLYTAPATGQLVAMDSHRRVFSGLLRHMVLLRDGICRTPYCDAPIRHIDHATPHRDGGRTAWDNASGLCVRCNHTKENPGWTHHASADELRVTTPTGHEYTNHPRPLTPPPEPEHASTGPSPAEPPLRAPGQSRVIACSTNTAVTATLPDNTSNEVPVGSPTGSMRPRATPRSRGSALRSTLRRETARASMQPSHASSLEATLRKSLASHQTRGGPCPRSFITTPCGP
ncbi:HNH endonuclease [Citricoccus alkalitolerans]|uniref:HNH endonuclease n=1 Tax=Citricoccus alkalitolerans TaxID=246603 RepID=A0ABV8XYM5_9MICC